MNDQVILVIGTSKYLLNLEEAFDVCRTLNGASRITQTWLKSGNVEIIGEPEITSASVVPMTAHYQFKLENNMKEKDAR